ncbi:hypothetical protein EJ05DRAFT_332020 [Pseudovirgaria hyperparasitica]|uniref:Uncharacterized protein n=1 Tax=Pseudovirgaria hyperparasitica TaxID=470096 RepID=A0A6A6WAU8_9PEZI|nr:uncharacterized protein EJ05DRAFT_332020 [Pseudovirgaria hyperparasitica]KAF2759080.1 hypothetical protein EJ05DRAFT_332020 [Pseudovirgaria hyperparasitica]
MPSLSQVESTQSTISESGDTIFDSAAENSDYENESATDLSSSVFSDHGLPPDVDRDEPLINSRAYYQELENLETNVISRSGLHLMKSTQRQEYPTGVFNLHVAFPDQSSAVLTWCFPNYDDQVIQFCKSDRSFSSKGYNEKDAPTVFAYWAYHLLECRNLMLGVLANVEEMRRVGFCDESINYLTLDPSRDDVVRLITIHVETIRSLHVALEHALDRIVSFMQKGADQWTPEIQGQLNQVTQAARALLQDCPVKQQSFSECTIWRTASILCDLAVVSYSGAHVERFDTRHIQQDLDFAKITTAWTFATRSKAGLVLRRRSLRCLGEFLAHQKVWVIQPQSSRDHKQDLWLSASVNQLADIWGPVWAVMNESTTVRYNAGPGAIVAWSSSFKHPPLNDEILCHWLRLGETYPSEPIGNNTEQTLLIGAPTVVDRRTSCLKENEECQNKTRKVIRQLKSQHLLEEIGTRAGYSELAEESVQLGMGFQGVQLGGTRVYKRRAGVTLKDAICDAWRNKEGNRNPAILEHFLGVEVSFCSRNARRRRLKSILNCTTMRNWLEACKTNAEPSPCEKAFHEALQDDDPYAFRHLWKRHREWRRDLEQLVSWCLDGLRYSSFEQDGTLRALWMPHDDTRYRVKLKNNPHSWTSFLADSKDTCAFVVMSGRCLQSDYKAGATCQTTLHPYSPDLGYPLLETSLVINPRAPKPSGLELRKINVEKNPHSKRPWRISQLHKGDRFGLESGRLKVIETFASTRLLVDYEGGIVKMLQDATRSVVRAMGDEPLYHWELREDDDAATKPIPLFILSQYELRRG